MLTLSSFMCVVSPDFMFSFYCYGRPMSGYIFAMKARIDNRKKTC